MKPAFVFIVVIVSLGIGFASAQTYHPFPTTTATWAYQFRDDFGVPTNDYNICIMDGDTMLNNHVYKKINYSGSNPWFTFSGFYAIREINKRIYVADTTPAQESLLYDFNVQAGDTLFNVYGSDSISFCPNDTEIVWYTDSVLCSDGYHMAYHVGNAHIAEGIGNIWGGDVGSPLYCAIVSGYFYFNCFSDSATQFPPGVTGYCTPVGLPEIKNKTISINPNPFVNELKIENAEVNIGGFLNVYDVFGRKVYSENITNSTIEISTSNWESDIYFLEIVSDSQKFIVKVVKQ